MLAILPLGRKELMASQEQLLHVKFMNLNEIFYPILAFILMPMLYQKESL
jgi:hypothetical protein